MPGRSGSVGGYRYGFQGQETDDEIYGSENAVSFKYRVHDARVGRFLSVDPLAPKYPFYSPYVFSGNRVIDSYELEGLEPVGANPQRLLYSGDEVDMSQAPRRVQVQNPRGGTRWIYTTTNTLGERRNHAYYWQQVMKSHPEYFSPANQRRISHGLAPYADGHWIDHHPEHAPWRLQKLEHHHVGHGPRAKALPWKAHRGAGNFRTWHLSPGALRALRNAQGFIPVDITDISGYAVARPSSVLMQLEGLFAPLVGKLYEDFGSGTGANYFIIREQTSVQGDDGTTTTTSVIDYYKGFVRNDDGTYEPDEDSFVGQGVFRETTDKEGNHTGSTGTYNGSYYSNGERKD